MAEKQKTQTPRWIKLRRSSYEKAGIFLRAREERCVSACVRFLQINSRKDEIWALPGRGGKDGDYSGILLYSRNSLFPVLDGGAEPGAEIPPLDFMKRPFAKPAVHAIHGPADDAELIEKAMENNGCFPAERIDYDLMILDEQPGPGCFRRGPADLVIRPPEKTDYNEIYALQSAYEKEEVLPRGAVFYPASCRANLERILCSERVLVACTGGQIVGKINTSGAAFSRYQIGGVYVRPDYRGKGIAVRMAAVFLSSFINGEGMGAGLFVKKANAPARAAYRRLGFRTRENYRISYY